MSKRTKNKKNNEEEVPFSEKRFKASTPHKAAQEVFERLKDLENNSGDYSSKIISL